MRYMDWDISSNAERLVAFLLAVYGTHRARVRPASRVPAEVAT